LQNAQEGRSVLFIPVSTAVRGKDHELLFSGLNWIMLSMEIRKIPK
jgi:hypothetical protein